MEYYIYISDTKVDMLFSQIPPGLLDGLAGGLKVNLGVISASLSQESVEHTRYSKLKIVEKYIRGNLNVGSIDSPQEYFAAEVAVRWGPYKSVEEPQVVYFGGQTSQTIFGLGGSFHHVIGEAGGSVAHSHSITPHLVAALARELAFLQPDDRMLKGDSESDISRCALHAVYLATTQMEGSEQRVKFLAKRLLEVHGPSNSEDDWWRPDGVRVLLGTPIYVALSE